MSYDRDRGIPDENMSIDDILSGFDGLGDDPSLESILAEYKGEAFIDGDKRTPSDILQKKTDEIVSQVTGKLPAQKVQEEEKVVQKAESPKPQPQKSREEMDEVERWFDEFVSSRRSVSIDKTETEEIPEPTAMPEYEKNSYEEPASSIDEGVVTATAGWTTLDFTDPTSVDKFAKELSVHMENEAIVDEPYEEIPTRKRAGYGKIYIEDAEDNVDLEWEAHRFSAPLKSLTFRLLGAGIICALMTVFVYLFYAGKSLPLGIGTNQFILSGVLLIMQMAVMILGLDIFISAVNDVIRAEPGAESLLLVSSIMTIIDSFVIFLKQDEKFGLPFCIITAWAVFFALWGRKAYYSAMCDSIRISMAGSAPYGVISENEIEGRSILKKIPGNTEGFYRNLVQADSSENAYAIAAPLLILMSFVFAFIASVGHGKPENFSHSFAVMLAVAAVFPATMAFALPFKYVSKRVKHAGCAVAGWGGACSVSDADSAIITDEDLFPVGTVSLSGVKLFGNMSQRKAIVYTSSLIIASKSGLMKVFAALLKEQNLNAVRIKDFACYEGGGIGALIDGERVLVGSGAFMNLMGIRVPESINLNNSVFTAINDELCAVFTINYVPANSVQNALISVLNTQVDILLAVRDFNVSPSMIEHKFKVSMEGVKIIPAEVSYKVSEEKVPEGTLASAVLCREGLGPFAEVITSGRLLKKITDVNTIISVGSAVIGVLLMFFLCWTEAFASASVKNVMLFMMIIQLCVVLLSKIVKQRF